MSASRIHRSIINHFCDASIMSTLRSATLFVIMAVALGLVACDGGQPEPQPTPTAEPTPTSTPTPIPTPTPSPTPIPPTPTPTSTPTPIPPTPTPTSIPTPAPEGQTPTPEPRAEPPPDPAQILAMTVDAMAAVESFHFITTGSLETTASESEMTISITFEGDSLSPDRTSARLTLGVSVFLLEIEIVTIGADVYLTNPMTGEWEVTSPEDFGIPDPVLLISGVLPSLNDMKIVGEERIAEVPTYHLSGSVTLEDPDILGADLESVDIWIGVEDSLLYRISTQGLTNLDDFGLSLEDMGLGGEGTIALQIDLSDFNEPVVIEPPIVN